MDGKRRTIRNRTDFDSTALRQCVKAALSVCGYDTYPSSLVFEPGGPRLRRCSFYGRRDGVLHIRVPNRCKPRLLVQELGWNFQKRQGDDPGRYLPARAVVTPLLLEMGLNPEEPLPKAAPPEKLPKPAQALAHAEKKVAALEQEIEEARRAIVRKQKLLKKWRSVARRKARELETRPKRLEASKARRDEESQWRARLREKSAQMASQGPTAGDSEP